VTAFSSKDCDLAVWNRLYLERVLDRASLMVCDFDLTYCSFRQGGTGQKEICFGSGKIDLDCEWRLISDWKYCRADAFLSNCILFDFDY
jgi:hypothetical protein